MAKKAKEKLVWLECSECDRKTRTTFNSRKKEKKLALRKHCRFCKKATLHKESK